MRRARDNLRHNQPPPGAAGYCRLKTINFPLKTLEFLLKTLDFLLNTTAYHDTLLSIGDGKQGFSLTTIDRKLHAAAVAELTAASLVDKGIEASIKTHSDARSGPYIKLQKPKPLPSRSNRERFKRLWQLGRPDGLYKKLAGMFVFFGAQIWLAEFRHFNEGRMYGALMAQDRRLMLLLLAKATACAFATAWVIETFLYIQKEIAATMSERVTTRLQERYIKNQMYYRLHYLDGTC